MAKLTLARGAKVVGNALVARSSRVAGVAHAQTRSVARALREGITQPSAWRSASIHRQRRAYAVVAGARCRAEAAHGVLEVIHLRVPRNAQVRPEKIHERQGRESLLTAHLLQFVPSKPVSHLQVPDVVHVPCELHVDPRSQAAESRGTKGPWEAFDAKGQGLAPTTIHAPVQVG